MPVFLPESPYFANFDLTINVSSMSTIKLLTVVGARPQIIKASAISRCIINKFPDQIKEVLVHTGQHYDKEMSQVFFDELEIEPPSYNLAVGSSTHGKQIAGMVSGLEQIILNEHPDGVLLYGDTNSTLAGAIIASKHHVPLIHIEAGLRSFNKSMPEELNRLISDHSSTLLFAPTNTAFRNLMNEGLKPENSPPYTIDNPKIYLTGDIMYDNAIFYGDLAGRKKSTFIKKLGIAAGEFVLATIHRDTNTDIPERLDAILRCFINIGGEYSKKFILPLHPRTLKTLKSNLSGLYAEIIRGDVVKVIKPVSYLEMIMLEKHSMMVITDSGGVQKESHFFKKPCIVLRKETEWTELVKNGTAVLADADPVKIRSGFEFFMKNTDNLAYPAFYGDGKAAEFILGEIRQMMGNS